MTSGHPAFQATQEVLGHRMIRASNEEYDIGVAELLNLT